MAKGKEYDRKDEFYERAKSEGYRSRAAYKLKELSSEYKLLGSGYAVLDLGAWPGSWMQVALERVGDRGIVAGIDLKTIEPFGPQNAHIFTGDVGDEAILAQIKLLAPAGFDLVLSDMSPHLTGIKEADRAGMEGCAELALWVAQKYLKVGGNFVVKLFKSHEADQFVKTTRPLFNTLKRSELDSTRKSSNEYYMIGLGFKKA
jgi:23S rRNA (uridine2552-2'-O)-methyltransferase